MTRSRPERLDAPEPALHPTVKGTPGRPRLVLSVLMGWMQALGLSALFFLLGRIIDLLRHGDRVRPGLWWLIAAAIGITAVVNGVSTWFTQRNMARAEHRLHQAVVDAIFARGPALPSSGSGTLFSLATDAVAKTAHYRAGFLGPITGSLTTPLVALAFMAVAIDPETAGLIFLLLFMVPLLIGSFQKLVRPIGRVYQQATTRLTSAFLEAIQALETLVYARAAHRMAGRLTVEGQRHRRSLMRMLAVNQLLIFVVDASFSLAVTVAATAIAIWKTSLGQITVGEAIAIVLMSVLIIGPVNVIGQFFYIGIGGRASQRAISNHLILPPRTTGLGEEATAAQAGIVVEDVHAGWTEGHDVLSGLSMRVAPGERVAIVGPSGVGKSTLSAVIQGALQPTSGRVLVDGLDTRHHPPEQIRARFSVIEQRSFLFIGTIADNLRLAKPDASEPELWAALEMAGLAGEVRAMTEGINTPVGEHGMLLSGGQSQRLAIARAALRDAPILILDEPTSQVDLAGEAAILESLDRLAAGRTVIMIAHRPHAILAADRVIVLASSRVGS